MGGGMAGGMGGGMGEGMGGGIEWEVGNTVPAQASSNPFDQYDSKET